MLTRDDVRAELRTKGSLTQYLRDWATLDGDGGPCYEEQVLEFGAWVAEHPDEAAAFKALLADAILRVDITPGALESITGGVIGDASMADVESSLRKVWFDFFDNEPIPGDLHPLPDWWWHWVATAFLTENNNDNPDFPFTGAKLDWLTSHGLTQADREQMWDLIGAITMNWNGEPVNFYRLTGYLRHLRARWEAGDRSAVPSLPPRREDVDGWEDYLTWWPGPSIPSDDALGGE